MRSVYNNDIHWGTPQKWPGCVIFLQREKKFSLLNHFFARFHVPVLCGKIAAGEKGYSFTAFERKEFDSIKTAKRERSAKMIRWNYVKYCTPYQSDGWISCVISQ